MPRTFAEDADGFTEDAAPEWVNERLGRRRPKSGAALGVSRWCAAVETPRVKRA